MAERFLSAHLGETAEGSDQQIRDAYGFALLLILVSMFILIAANAPYTSPLALVSVVMQVGALIVTLRVSGVRRRVFVGGTTAASVVVLAVLVALIMRNPTAVLFGLVGWLFLTLATPIAIGRRLASYRIVNIQLVLGLLCIYLLVGLAFGLSYLLAQVIDPGAFAQGRQTISSLVYYSFITIATIGYGDITPAGSYVRAMAVGEAIFGQLYLVSIVSLAVSRLGLPSASGRATTSETEASETE